ncbi:MAG: hypothetical protein INR68_18200, partial [Methylobacterium mesophilicum]|nr:hypothetical protein [Methylobacterium mesophilicum]
MSAVLHSQQGAAGVMPAAYRAEIRRRLADAAESIIALLDVLDGDPEAEDGSD